MPRGPSRPYPNVSLEDALTVPSALRDNNAGRPMNRILLAEAMDLAPAGTVFRDLVTAANKFGLTTGNYNSDTIGLTALGEKVANPETEEEHLNATRQAMEKVPLFRKLLDHYNNNRLPAPNIFKQALEHDPFNVPAQWSAEAAETFEAAGRLTGNIRDVGGNAFVLREAGPPVPRDEAADDDDVPDNDDVGASAATEVEERPVANAVPPLATELTPVPETEPKPAEPRAADRQFFIAHGRDKTALSQLQSILKDLDIPYLVAEEEPNVGRPISQKIADLMRACSAGVFIFSGDEEVTDPDGNATKRPRPNVVYELGAASLLYGQRIVIFKEMGVEFPTDFRDLGYIEYEKDLLSAKSMELLRELIKLRAVRVMPGG